MAEPLSQNEIDDLLGGDDDFDETDSEDLLADTDDETGPRRKIMNFSSPQVEPYRFHFKYSSPILKNDRYMYNPSNESDTEFSSGAIVRSLSNYAHFKKSQQA